GLYLHWPFCQAKCPYCDFNSHVVASVDQNRWAAAFEAEIDRAAALTSDRLLNSIFFGGGTPSLMDPRTVDRIMSRVQARWRLANDLEVTLEANPTSIEAKRFAGYQAAGVNRVSIGVQALNDRDLKALGRLHSANEALAAIDVARSNFDRVSFDLIYARQNQALSDWEAELEFALSLGPDHLSLYQLTVEDGTAFGDRFKRGRLRGLPDENLAVDLWDTTQATCNSAGLPAYEVSNHAKPGQESRHNLIYWRSGDWVGIGPGSHGRLTINGSRVETIDAKMPGDWISRIERGETGKVVNSVLKADDVLDERILMGLRIAEGIDVTRAWIKNKSNNINVLEDLDYIKLEANRLTVTPQGRPLLNSIISQLLAN
ncbi:UNVERIFIED_CONTAM: hypothetical protein GTU68_014681, partial [Idotea baltica]|nr:hypothetical protein [Idotea baltica]